jgi:putative membrane protein
VGLVNQDKGYTYRAQQVDIGGELVTQLMRKNDFGYHPVVSPELARERVRLGELAFAIIIPPDFSALALPARMADQGKLEIYVSAGNNYQTYLIAQKYAEELDAELNQTLNQQRWKFVLNSEMASKDFLELKSALSKIQKGTQELHAGLNTAVHNGHRLRQGASQLGEEVNRLASGTQQLGQFVRGMESAFPPADDVRRLRVGAEDLVKAHHELDKALEGLHAGSLRLTQGIEQFKQHQLNVLFFSSNLEEALDPLQTGLVTLKDGLGKAQSGHRQLTSGSEALRDSIRSLAFGVRDMRAEVRQTVARLPENQQLTQLGQSALDLAAAQSQLEQGLRRLSDGSVYLDTSMQWILNRIPSKIQLIDGSPEGLAHSVMSELKVVSRVSHLGAAMVPNVIPVALWLGAGIAIFLIRGRHIALFARTYASTSKLLAKALVPIMVVCVQSTLLMVLLWLAFDLQAQHWAALVALIYSTAISFVVVLLLFIRWVGDMGKALAMLLLALQISASGGVVPIELSSEFFSALSPWLPMTWIVQGLKAAMFEAYGGDWFHPLIQTWGLTLACGWLAVGLGRWHYCQASRLRPAFDV